jgi:hypothetical protein
MTGDMSGDPYSTAKALRADGPSLSIGYRKIASLIWSAFWTWNIMFLWMVLKQFNSKVYYPSRFFPPFWLDIDHPKEIDITEPDG